ncbi:MAG TPA: urea transporter, partial [Bacteroidaceae bacterium]|nr:urea transporter [Bacteroidaceae bacterium]
IILFIINHFLPELNIIASSANAFHEIDFGFAFRGYGQIVFQDSLLSGVIFFVAVFVNSPIAALYGLAGSVMALFVSIPFSIPVENINLGLVSYNAVLCAIVFAGNKIKEGIWVLFSVVLTTIISLFMIKLPFPQLTFPFVAASLITLVLKNKIRLSDKKKNN